MTGFVLVPDGEAVNCPDNTKIRGTTRSAIRLARSEAKYFRTPITVYTQDGAAIAYVEDQ